MAEPVWSRPVDNCARVHHGPRTRYRLRIKLPQSVILKRFRRRVLQRQKQHRHRGGKRLWPAAKGRRRPEFAVIMLPTEISLRQSAYRRLTIRACRVVRETFISDGRDVLLDFSRTKAIKSEGMLLLYAEVDRAIRMGRTEQIMRCKLPTGQSDEAQIVRQVLEQIGLLHRLGATTKPPAAGDNDYHESVRHWRYATGTRVDEKPGDVLEKHEGRVAPGLMQGMQVGLTEALINSLHHAYKTARNDGCSPFNERRWWMFTHERAGMLNVLVCDLGIGIPRSLPLTWDRDLLKKLTSLFSGAPKHVAAIKMALVLGESSTGDEHRGKGLPQIWNATAASSAGGVGILGGKAYVGLQSETGAIYENQFSTDIMGTVIFWTVPVESTDGPLG